MDHTKPVKRFPGWLAAFLALVLFSGTIFIGRRLVKDRQEINLSNDKIEIIASDIKPKTPPELAGIVLIISNENLTVQEAGVSSGLGLGQDTVKVEGSIFDAGEPKDPKTDPSSGWGSLPDGRVTEVVITHETQIYKNVTQPVEIKYREEVKIQEDLRPGTLEEVKENFFVSVWGERRGDRVVADFIIFRTLGFSPNE